MEIEPGETLAAACVNAQEVADKCEWPVEFQFNSVRCVAIPGGDAQELADRQNLASRTVIQVRSNGSGAPELIQQEAA